MRLTMRNRGARIALVGLVLLVQTGAAWELWNVGRERGTRLVAARRFDAEVRGLRASLVDLRTAQQAYVAEGQGQGNWFGKASAALEALRARLAAARALAASPATAQAIDGAASLLETFAKTDEQARGLITSEQRLMASDLIFGDSAATFAALGARLDEARDRETEDMDLRLGRLHAVEVGAAVAAAAVSVVGLLLLLPVSGAPRQPDRPPRIGALPPDVPATAPAPQPPPAASPSPDLDEVSKLCVEFGRVGDPSALPQLIERVASVLNASGLIVWMVNPKVGALHPVLSHGYSELAIARIGELTSDEDNATAEAFRTGEMRVVAGGGGAHGAIAVPLVTPGGCVGVLAAEIRDGGEKNKATRAIAAIVAAQLASLSSASPAAS
jgi:hypothetical protein